MPSRDDLALARRTFQDREARDVFYRAASELVDLSLRRLTSSLSTAEALAILLKTWNVTYYRFHKRFGPSHFAEIENLLERHGALLAAWRAREIESLSPKDEEPAMRLFSDFEAVLGPVGAAKALHLLMPSFCPLWDRAIAKAYGLSLRPSGQNAPRYWRLMAITREQACSLRSQGESRPDLLKGLDEYNYCRFTNKWM